MKKESLFFVLMNIFGAPFTWIIAYAFLDWYGILASLIAFLVSYMLWKRFGNNSKARLSINPTFSFGSKKWRLFKN